MNLADDHTPALIDEDRRRGQRERCEPPMPLCFEWDRQLYHGCVVDRSERDLGVLLPENPGLDIGQMLTIELAAPSGRVVESAYVSRIEHQGSQWFLGLLVTDFEHGPPPLVDMDQVKVDPTWALRVPGQLAHRRQMLPIAYLNDVVFVAVANPDDAATLQTVQRFVKHPITAVAAEPISLRRAISRVYGDAKGGRLPEARAASVDIRDLADPEGGETVQVCNELLQAAVLRQASDIHIDPWEDVSRVRLRVDGVLEEYRVLPIGAHGAIISRLKVQAGMDIAEKRAPQDGRFRHTFGSGKHAVDIRVATLPTEFGERMTLRLLALQTESLTLERLGMSPLHLQRFREAIAKPHGLILHTGPTGSGKTTTLYAAIRELLGGHDRNVITVEDPVEYRIQGVAQVEVDSADKVSFEKALRSLLRHDPDVVMIGEIRDPVSADVAIKASLTGHLVFSTLHTNSAAGAVTRLRDMGVEPFLIASTLRLAVAQRLVRRLCRHCRQLRSATPWERQSLACSNEPSVGVFEPQGCLFCAGRGYNGRLGLFEMLPIDQTLSEMISTTCHEADLVEYMQRQGLFRLIDDGRIKSLAGETSVAEVLATVTIW